MELYKGFLFHNRYELVASLGSGASAEVWKAKDTKANDLMVALKIFSQNSDFDSYGLQNFEREFTTVYNMRHQNLLPPTGYDIFEGRPYLVMQYCENGSCSSMAGRMEEDDIIKFLHDVSAGLEYLHDHNIIHQDIKPDNILLDDNCNFMVTDFGISVNSDNGLSDSNGMSGGTRAYMGPERFDGVTVSASDIWSLGATAVELLTGNPPYGEHGGLLQAEGEPLPELPALQPEVSSIILRCLERQPEKRITASEIRQKIELFWETGSWVKRSRKVPIAIAATATASLLMCLGIFLWDYNRTKVYYYKDYAEHWGVPEGIARLSPGEMKHKEQCYRFECKKRKVVRMALVNSAGKVITHTDTEHLSSRHPDVRYFYTADGKLDYTAIYDQNGKMLYKLDYDENLKTATIRQNDEYGTEMNLSSNVNDLYKGNTESVFQTKSRISRYLLTFDDDGLLTEMRYAALQNLPATDENRIHGQRYKYDDEGRRTEVAFIGLDGSLMGDKNGMAIRRYTYDDNDDWTSVTYLNAEGKPSHDGNNCYIVRIEYDKYGNRIKETYHNGDGALAYRTDVNTAGFKYTYDDNGFRTTTTCLDTDGKPTYCTMGFVTQRDSLNTDGFKVREDYLDENGNLVQASFGSDSYASVSQKPNATGLPLERTFYDENGDPTSLLAGASTIACTYDSLGNLTEEKYYGTDGQPVAINGFYEASKNEYDAMGRLTKQYLTNSDGSPATDDGTVAQYNIEYNLQGAITKVTFIGVKGAPVLSANSGTAGYSIEYDERGNQKAWTNFGTDGKPRMSADGFARAEYSYDEATNLQNKVRLTNAQGKEVRTIWRKYDKRGNMTEEWSTVGGKLERATTVQKWEYDVNNRVAAVWNCDLTGKRVNEYGKDYSLTRFVYDERGNRTQTTYWSATDKPAVDEQKCHKRVSEFDAMNRVVHELNYSASGKPLSGKDVNPEGRVKYDKFGNPVEISCYDGYGNPRLSAGGFYALRRKYNKRRLIVHEEYIDTDGKPIVAAAGYAKADFTYDDHGNKTEAKYYDKTKCTKIERQKFNDKNQPVEILIMDGNGKQSDKFYGASKIVIDYDDTGIKPIKRKYYSQSGKLLFSQKWDDAKGQWGEYIQHASYATSQQQAAQVRQFGSSTNWQAQVHAVAQTCPMKMADGVYLQDLSYTSSSVTFTIKLTEVSKYDMGEMDDSAMRSVCSQSADLLKASLSLPSSVSVRIVLTDKANRTIYSYR